MAAVINVLLPIFGLILAGYICRRTGRLGETAASELNRFVVWLCLPALLFSATATASLEEIWRPGFIAVVSIGTMAVYALTLGYRWFRQRRLADASIDGLSAAYANTGYIGIPLCVLVLGDDGLEPALIATLIVVCLLFSVAIVFVEVGLQNERSAYHAIRKVLVALAKNPLVVSPILGGCWAASGAELPEAAGRFLDLLGAATTPCALVSLGAFLAQRERQKNGSAAAALVGIKLIIHPLLVWVLASYVFVLPPLWAKAALLLSALPTGTGPFMLAEFYRREAAVVAQTVLWSTMGSVVTLSVCLYWIG
ncbi:AEC family transporter [Marinobacter nanhaiticus D15-8W]|uniref:AEC family transporter n=1 Tax=Marinobacter nanhaiticus D15-8W TaxID=626887 RepID=N6W6T0_9GAMM|nr:AEC family transporter [Marinobacter nanhaiticus]ENO15974.1 AEC family transporter [Marinobacter nanhaiticus D15-8W]BES73168.1 AEC family transporter [Marinobacter nanhaiticus D15-8W]